MAVYKRSNSPFYFIGFEYQGKRCRVSARTTSRRQAEQYEAQLRKQVYDEQVLGKTTHEPMRFEDAVKRYASTHLKTKERLTTVSLILTALGQLLQKEGEQSEITQKKLTNYFLANAEEDGDLRYKLLLTQSDRPTLMRLVDGKEPPEKASK